LLDHTFDIGDVVVEVAMDIRNAVDEGILGDGNLRARS